MAIVLTGNELLYVQGIQSNGQLAATTAHTTTGAIAALASQETTVSNTASLVITSTTTLTPIPGMSVTLTQTGSYVVFAELPVASTGGGGVALSIGGTATASSMNVAGQFFSISGSPFVSPITSLNSAVGTSSPVVMAELTGVIVVSAAGTITVNAGQQASNASSTTIQPNGFLQVAQV